MAAAVGVNFHGRRRGKPWPSFRKTMVIGVENHGQRNSRRRATKFRATGNENHSNGQRDFLNNGRRDFWGTTDNVSFSNNRH